ncbi:hypothetical protein K523DRAFT_324947 [Schizophyllum commune Tattone D]|nr:hypothetical protein K523DRAFT_324947 [Schizophyllum commune Tattone D]
MSPLFPNPDSNPCRSSPQQRKSQSLVTNVAQGIAHVVADSDDADGDTSCRVARVGAVGASRRQDGGCPRREANQVY